MSDVFESIGRQGQFFDTNRPGQIILRQKDAENHSKDEKKEVFALYAKHNFLHKGRIPSAMRLAIRARLQEVYEFFYSATSKWVHFSPHILMRMGWSNSTEKDAIYTYATSHFSNYYAGFNTVYGTYLFGLFCEIFEEDLSLDPKVRKYVTELGQWIGSLSRWPELVTFEEMNIKRPSLVLSELYRSAKKLAG
jgi:hypothetical protein